MSRDINDFKARIVPRKEITNDMIESCQETWQLFFEENISKFVSKI
jgi:hypothetical protein